MSTSSPAAAIDVQDTGANSTDSAEAHPNGCFLSLSQADIKETVNTGPRFSTADRRSNRQRWQGADFLREGAPMASRAARSPRLHLTLSVLALLLASLSTEATEQFWVDTEDDLLEASCAPASLTCSLRAAVKAANVSTDVRARSSGYRRATTA